MLQLIYYKVAIYFETNDSMPKTNYYFYTKLKVCKVKQQL